MATGVYSTIRPATVDISDVEIFYTFSPSRESIGVGSVNRLNPNDVLVAVKHPDSQNQILGGLYSLKLPAINFSQRGFYNIVIRPRSFSTLIVDCGVLSSINIKGLILDTNRSELADFQSKFTTNAMVGYQIQYLSDDDKLIPNKFVIITSNNRCEPIVGSLNNTTQKSVSYRLFEQGSLVFVTVSPSSASSVKPNSIPQIGSVNQKIIISNSFFNPQMIEIELVEWNTESLAILLAGNQTKDISSGIRTSTDFQGNIFKQWNEFEILSPNFNELQFEVREIKETLDQSQLFSTIIEGI